MQINTSFSHQLLQWYSCHGRHELPWKIDFNRSQDSYYIWLSEIMLQQTQVKTVLDYYTKFTSSFENVTMLANADNDTVMSFWSGLGYYARARNLHKTAQIVRDDYAGVFPTDFDVLMSLPGIGRSTAAAISAFSTGQSHAILDGNVKRVLARLYAINKPTSDTATQKILWNLAQQHTPVKQNEVTDYTQAIMDFGATVCTRKPLCLNSKESCFASDYCRSYQKGAQQNIPVAKKRKPKPSKTVAMPMLVYNNEVFLQKRPSKGIWGDLWSLPEITLLDTKQLLSDNNDKNDMTREALPLNVSQLYLVIEQLFGIMSVSHLAKKDEVSLISETSALYSLNNDVMCDYAVYKHSFSHYDLYIKPLKVELTDLLSQQDVLSLRQNREGRWLSISREEIENSPLPAPIEKILIKYLIEHSD